MKFTKKNIMVAVTVALGFGAMFAAPMSQASWWNKWNNRPKSHLRNCRRTEFNHKCVRNRHGRTKCTNVRVVRDVC